MKLLRRSQYRESGFTVVEIIVGIVLLSIMAIGLTTAYVAIRQSYTTARELSEMYIVLSACPEVDRALEFTSLSGSTNCYPNNSFQVENTTAARTITYTPSLTVVNTTSLNSSDPLYAVPDSKVVDISLPFRKSAAQPLKLRMLITRNGIGQQ